MVYDIVLVVALVGFLASVGFLVVIILKRIKDLAALERQRQKRREFQSALAAAIEQQNKKFNEETKYKWPEVK